MGEPLYLRVQRDLALRISAGEWAPDDFLPSEQQLQEHYRVSRTTVRKAVGDLVAAGLVVIDRGNGTRVAQPRPHRPETGLMSFSATMRDLGRVPGIAAPHACVDGDQVHVSRVHTADGEPVSFSESWLPLEIFAGFDPERLADQASLYAQLAELDLGVTEVVDSYGIALADQAQAEALQIAVGSPLLLIDRVGYAADQRPIESGRIVAVADRYRPSVITRSE